jgi:hypothetical protein
MLVVTLIYSFSAVFWGLFIISFINNKKAKSIEKLFLVRLNWIGFEYRRKLINYMVK